MVVMRILLRRHRRRSRRLPLHRVPLPSSVSHRRRVLVVSMLMLDVVVMHLLRRVLHLHLRLMLV